MGYSLRFHEDWFGVSQTLMNLDIAVPLVRRARDCFSEPGAPLRDPATRVPVGFFLYWVYFWYSSDNGAILVQYIPDGFSASESGLFVQNFGIGIEENAAFAQLVGTTVVTDELLLQFHAAAPTIDYAIVNASGAVAQQGTMAGAAEPGEVRSLDVSTLSPSIYFLRLGDGTRTETLRFVKER